MVEAKPEGDSIFDRQERIPGWNQAVIASQSCLILGAGGLGCTVSMALCRMGVRKIILVDKDVVNLSNLNRQVLFNLYNYLIYNRSDVGKYKATAAAENLNKWHNVNGTVIEAYDICALKNWQKIIELAKQSTAIFNMIDVGDYFDIAVQSLAIINKVPYILGGTFSQQFSIDFIKPKPEEACIKCMFDNVNAEIVKRLTPDKVIAESDISFIPRNDNPIGQSTVYLASMCAQMMVARLSTYLLQDEELEKISFQRLVFYVSTGESVKFQLPKDPKCPICGN